MRKPVLGILLIVTLSLAACKPNITNPTSTLSSNEVATQVSKVLTQMPSQTYLPQQQNTNPPSSTSTLTQSPTLPKIVPTSTLEVTSTAQLSATPTNPFTPTLTKTPAISPTLSAGDPRIKFGNPTWQDTFKDDSNWPTGSDIYTSIEIKNNTLNLTALTKTDGWRLSYPHIQNFYLEATLESDNCTASDHFGLIIRVPDPKTANQGYLVGISCDGQYSLRKWDGSKLSNLIKWTTSKVINSGSGKSNRLGIMAVGDHFGIFVNGSLLAESSDNTYSEGVIGVFVGGQTPNLTVTIASIAYWENP
jgi:hypothetical protein